MINRIHGKLLVPFKPNLNNEISMLYNIQAETLWVYHMLYLVE